MRHERSVSGAVFSEDESRILTWSEDGTARVRRLRWFDGWPSEHVALHVEVRTGTRLNDVGEVEVIPPDEWREMKRKYDEIERQLSAKAKP
jgi:hypothetical protein